MSNPETLAPPLKEAVASKEQKFGTFMGVYLPSVMTIFGVIMYMRLGWIVGVGGLGTTIAIIALGSLITLITALSISSITTNMPMASGGVYYMLSRTFGIELGSATCIPLYLSQALSISFYLAGFAESIHNLFPFVSLFSIKLFSLAMLSLFALYSTHMAMKVQFGIFCIMALSLGSLLFGHTATTGGTMSSFEKLPFWALFAIFFPAVTGIESGVSMSGELKNPRRSLPFGTISAVLTGLIIYLTIAIYLSTHATKSQLVSNLSIVQDIAFSKELILAGIWGATLSSGLAGLLAAPRTLIALAEDRVVPKWIAKSVGKTKVPFFATCITIVIAYGGLSMGGVDSIAPVLSMFFLISYGMLNLATAFEDLFENPSWRPTFRTPWPAALGGFFLCVFAMLMIDPAATLLALFVIISIYAAIKKRQIRSNWEDIRQSFFLFLSRFAIYRLSEKDLGPKCWRPNLLVFLGDPFLRSHLVELTQALTHEKGFLIMSSILPGLENSYSHAHAYKEKMEGFFIKNNISTLVNVLESPTISHGMKQMIRSYGLGSLSPNTIVLGATEDPEMFSTFAEIIKLTHERKKNLVIFRDNKLYPLQKKSKKHIDVWWGGINRNNSELILVLAYMLQTSRNWKDSTISLKTIVTDRDLYKVTLKTLLEVSNKSRLHITPEVVIAEKPDMIFQDTMRKYSLSSDLVFMGLKPPHPDEPIKDYVQYYQKLLENTAHFPPLAFVLASEEIDFNQILL